MAAEESASRAAMEDELQALRAQNRKLQDTIEELLREQTDGLRQRKGAHTQPQQQRLEEEVDGNQQQERKQEDDEDEEKRKRRRHEQQLELQMKQRQQQEQLLEELRPAVPAHRRSRESPLSSGAIFRQSHAGLFNLCIVVLVAVNSRLIIENLMKYGLLIHQEADILLHSKSWKDWPLLMCGLSLPVFPLAAFLVEKLKALRPRTPDWAIWLMHALNIGVALAYPIYVIEQFESDVLSGFILMLIAITGFLKLLSYAHTNADIRAVAAAKRSPTSSSSRSSSSEPTVIRGGDAVIGSSGGEAVLGRSGGDAVIGSSGCDAVIGSGGGDAVIGRSVGADAGAVDAGRSGAVDTSSGAVDAASGSGAGMDTGGISHPGSGAGVGPSNGAVDLGSGAVDRGVGRAVDVGAVDCYPANISLGNIAYFMLAPTLCYQPSYPRSAGVRKGWVLRQLAKWVVFNGLMGFIIGQYVNPTVRNSAHPLQSSAAHCIERVLKLSIPTLYVWLGFFYCFFHLWLNVVAELLRFGDREFYKDWWNARTVEEYWRMWNMPVHKWLLRHVYYSCLRLRMHRQLAVLLVFAVSGVFHELCIAVPCHMLRGWAFLGIMLQVPLVWFTRLLHRRSRSPMLGNFIFWLFFCIIGQPMTLLLYYHDVVNRASSSAALKP